MTTKQKNSTALMLLSLAALALTACDGGSKIVKNSLRAPAYPLVTVDPYTSVWAFNDNLYDDNVRHWTGKEQPLVGALRVDGKVYRFMGIEKPVLEVIAPISYEGSWTGKYTFTEPQKGWEQPVFDDRKWAESEAAFGTPEEVNVKTQWLTKDIWVRRVITGIPESKLFLKYSHDDDFELYINGIKVLNTGYKWTHDSWLELPDDVRKSITDGTAVIAAHCNNRTGGALVDFGLYYEKDLVKHLATTAIQREVDVQATQTRYVFDCGSVNLTLTFTAPLLLNDLDLVSRPINYISYEIISNDGAAHQTEIYFEASPSLALNSPQQHSKAEGFEKEGLIYVKTGNVEQKPLNKKGDDVRIDWGWFLLGADKASGSYSVGEPIALREQFATTGSLNNAGGQTDNAYIAVTQSLGKSSKTSGRILLGYDDVYSIQYFGENLRPYWNRKGDKSIEWAFNQAVADYDKLIKACSRFDYKLMSDATAVGGKEYAEMCALAYRQSVAAHKIVEAPNGDLLFLSKENFSNGCINTVDVTYPSAPLYLLYSIDLTKGLLNGIFYYCENGKWKYPFAPHDLGTYPLANGQVYGMENDDYSNKMPVEESGNVLILTAAIVYRENSAAYAEKHWTTLTSWAEFLLQHGLDPENQLCTDDFAGHLAHNANLSIKAILGIASYGYMAEKQGKKDVAEKYLSEARKMAAEWMKMADDGDHYRLAFDRPGTWSQKYNIVWDKLLGFNIFPPEIMQKEIPYYLTKFNRYGLPLDNRREFTKGDWVIWSATLAPDQETFEKIIRPEWDFYNETVDRVPMSDWYNTDNPRHVGFQARSVVGGYFIKLLEKEITK
ncbi:MAG: DUF4965 domain-containing protein [Tannerella sp.]|jgi:hypothetical protein|nr:DUF4965 domain-containing protein [Tannerella sp.]